MTRLAALFDWCAPKFAGLTVVYLGAYLAPYMPTFAERLGVGLASLFIALVLWGVLEGTDD